MVKRFGLRNLAVLPIKRAQVVKGAAHVGVLGSQDLLPQGEALALERLGLTETVFSANDHRETGSSVAPVNSRKLRQKMSDAPEKT